MTSPFRLIINSDVPRYETELLITKLREISTVQESEKRAFGIDDVILIVTLLGSLAKAGTEVSKFVHEINEWRREVKAKGIEPKVKLQRPGNQDLDLNKATDEEVSKWFQK